MAKKRRGIIKRKQKQEIRMVKPNEIDKSKGLTSKEIEEKVDGMSLGGFNFRCLECNKEFSREHAEKKNEGCWWNHGYCSFKCFSKMIAEVRGKLKLRYGEYERPEISLHYRVKRKVVKRQGVMKKRKKRRIIKRSNV